MYGSVDHNIVGFSGEQGSTIAGLGEPSYKQKCNFMSHKFPCRYTLAILGCLGFAVVFAIRSNLSIALVAMTNYTSNDERTENNIQHKVPGEKFDWSQQTQGVILSSFYYGYLVTQLPGGWLASIFGGKYLFGLGVLSTSVLTLLTPWAARQGVGVLVSVRVLEGIFEGVTFPALQELFSSWAPPLERCTLTNIASAGLSLGIIIAQPVSGILCASGFLGGWPSVFYIFGSLGVVWCIAWVLLVFEKPTLHPRISVEEKDYIVNAIGSSQDKLVKKHRVPWLAMISSTAVHALVIQTFCCNWAYAVLLTDLPTYYSNILGFGILKNGFMSSIPYVIGLVTALCCFYGDFLVSRKFVTVTEIRKISVVAACVIPGCLLFALSYVGREGKTLAVVLVSLSIGFDGLNLASVNSIDIAPRFASLLMGISNSFGSLASLISPLVTGFITNNKPTRYQWQKVFYFASAMYLFGGLVYVLLGTGREQSWNTPPDEDLQEDDTERESEA